MLDITSRSFYSVHTSDQLSTTLSATTETEDLPSGGMDLVIDFLGAGAGDGDDLYPSTPRAGEINRGRLNRVRSSGMESYINKNNVVFYVKSGLVLLNSTLPGRNLLKSLRAPHCDCGCSSITDIEDQPSKGNIIHTYVEYCENL